MQLYEYNDTKDEANLDKLDNTTKWNIIDLNGLQWTNSSAVTNLSNHVIQLQGTSSNGENVTFNGNGSLSFTVSYALSRA